MKKYILILSCCLSCCLSCYSQLLNQEATQRVIVVKVDTTNARLSRIISHSSGAGSATSANQTTQITKADTLNAISGRILSHRSIGYATEATLSTANGNLGTINGNISTVGGNAHNDALVIQTNTNYLQYGGTGVALECAYIRNNTSDINTTLQNFLGYKIQGSSHTNTFSGIVYANTDLQVVHDSLRIKMSNAIQSSLGSNDYIVTMNSGINPIQTNVDPVTGNVTTKYTAWFELVYSY